MRNKNERVDLEMRIIKYKALMRLQTDEVTRSRIQNLISELQQKLREIDE
jgi:hypothetical protein